jgi:hypothetical protein
MHSYEGISRRFNYVDFGTQLFGNRGTCVPDSQTGVAGGPACTGVWDFYWNHWDAFAAVGMLPTNKPPEPTTWLREWYDGSLTNPCYCCQPNPATGVCDQSCDAACIADLAGIAFGYSPSKPTYAPYHRYPVDIASAGWAAWWPQVLQWDARAGFTATFFDNVGFTNCWNDDCQSAYLAYLDAHYTPEEIARYFTVTTSLEWDHSFESSWYQQANGDWYTPYSLVLSGKASPDIDAVGGAYSARLDGPADFEIYSTNAAVTSEYDFTVHYKTDAGVDATVTLNVGGVATVYTLPASTTWTAQTFRFFMPAGSYVFPIFSTPARLWLDELWLSNVDVSSGSEVHPHPTFTTAMWPLVDPNYATAARFGAAIAAWDGLVDDRLAYLKDAVQSIPEGQGYAFITNSYFPRRGADYFVREGQAFQAEFQMQDVGYPPGRYDVGNGTSLLRGQPVTSTVLVTNAVDWKYDHGKRFADEYSYGLHLPVTYPQEYAHNADSVTLAHAEAAAFGGGAGTDLVVQYYSFFAPYQDPTIKATLTTSTQQFFAFVEQHDDLYHCLRSFAEVGLVFHDQPSDAAQTTAIRLADAIGASGLTFDVLPKEQVTAANLQRFRAIVLPNVDRMSEAEAQLYIDYMAQGGVVVVSGPTAGYDELGRLRAANPSTIWPPVALGAGVETHPIGQGLLVSAPAGATGAQVAAWFETYVRPNATAFPGTPAATQAKLRVATWAGYAHLVAHVLNYDVPHGVDNGGQVVALPNLTVAVPLPPGAWAPTNVTLSSPETPGASTAVPLAVAGGVATFVIPSHRIYTVADLR